MRYIGFERYGVQGQGDCINQDGYNLHFLLQMTAFNVSTFAAAYRVRYVQVAINWCICQDTIPIPGAKSLKQAEEALGALDWRMSSAECEALETAADEAPQTMLQNIFQTK